MNYLIGKAYLEIKQSIVQFYQYDDVVDARKYENRIVMFPSLLWFMNQAEQKELIPAYIRNPVALNKVLQEITRQIYKCIDDWVNNMQDIQSLKKAINTTYYTVSILNYLQDIIPAYPSIATSIATYTVSLMVQIQNFLKEPLQIFAGVLRPYDTQKDLIDKDASILDPRFQTSDALQIAMLDFTFPFQLFPINLAKQCKFFATNSIIKENVSHELRQALILFSLSQDRPVNVSFSIVDREFIISTDQFQLGLYAGFKQPEPEQSGLLDHYASAFELYFKVSRINFCPELIKVIDGSTVKYAEQSVDDYVKQISDAKKRSKQLFDEIYVNNFLNNVLYPKQFIRNICIIFSVTIMQQLLIKTKQKWVLNLQRTVQQNNAKQIPNNEGIFTFWDYRVEEHFNEDTKYFRETKNINMNTENSEINKSTHQRNKVRPVIALVMRISNKQLINELTINNNQEIVQTLQQKGIYPHYQIDNIWKDKTILSELKHTQHGTNQRKIFTLRSICNTYHPSKQSSSEKNVYLIQFIRYDIPNLSLKIYGSYNIHFSELDEHISKMRQQLINLQYSTILNNLSNLYQIKSHNQLVFIDITKNVTVYVRLGLNLILYSLYYKSNNSKGHNNKITDITNLLNNFIGEIKINYSQLNVLIENISKTTPLVEQYMQFLNKINENKIASVTHTKDSLTYSLNQHFFVHFTMKNAQLLIMINKQEIHRINMNISNLKAYENYQEFMKDFLYENREQLDLSNQKVTKQNIIQQVLQQLYCLKSQKRQKIVFTTKYESSRCIIKEATTDQFWVLNITVIEEKSINTYKIQTNIENYQLQQQLMQLLINFYDQKISNQFQLFVDIIDSSIILQLSLKQCKTLQTNYASLDASSGVCYLLKTSKNGLQITKNLVFNPQFSNKLTEYPQIQKSKNRGLVLLSSFINSTENSFILSKRIIDPTIQLDKSFNVKKVSQLIKLRQIINFYGCFEQIGMSDDSLNQENYNIINSLLKEKEYYQFLDSLISGKTKIQITGNTNTVSIHFNQNQEDYIINIKPTQRASY